MRSRPLFSPLRAHLALYASLGSMLLVLGAAQAQVHAAQPQLGAARARLGAAQQQPSAAPQWLRATELARIESAARRAGSPPRLVVDRSSPFGPGQSRGPSGAGPEDDGGNGSGIVSDYPYYQPDCGTDLNDTVAGEGVDLAARGFDWRTPGEGFALLSFSVREYCQYVGDWGPDGSPPEEVAAILTADSSYRHEASGNGVNASQQKQSSPVTNVLYPWAATFASGGYAFWVYTYNDLYLAEPAGPTDPATGGIQEPGEPGVPPEELLADLIRSLAPDLDLDCFYRRSPGTWTDLPLLGVGDPRPAIPEKFEETAFYLDRLVAPPQSCAAPRYFERDYFSASFQRGNPTGGSGAGGDDGAGGSNDGSEPGKEAWAWLSVSAGTRLEADAEFPPYFDGSSLIWSDEGHYFSIYGYAAEAPIEQDVMFAIARALDPEFDPDAIVPRP